MTLLTVLLRSLPTELQPQQSAATKAPLKPSEEWLSHTFEDLNVDPRSRQASAPAGRPAAGSAQQLLADLTTMLVQTQALTSTSLQQVAEGLTHWTDAEMRH